MGRGTPKRTQETADAIVEWVSQGKTLRAFCRQTGAIAWRTVYDWLGEDEEFSARFARARELGFDAIAQEAIDISDEPSTHGDDVQHRKLQIWTRLQLLAKWDPKRYGEKVQIGGDPTGVPLKVESGAAVPSTPDLLTSIRTLNRLADELLTEPEPPAKNGTNGQHKPG